MQYLLITGATGLVGRYLLRDLLTQDSRLAVVVRPTRLQTAEQRVEAIMRQWEREKGFALPRPVVLPGDLNQAGLGLDAADTAWVSEHCDSVLHSAASLAFVEEPKTGEPFRTNVDGTKNLLQLCRQGGIRQFHHVSTAYVCGLRDDRVYEHEVDMGQKSCNPYEASKLAAEKLIRGADYFDRVSVYRPSSVLGDSVTGYTSTTHGFYLPLQLAYNSINRFPVNLMDDRFMKILGLEGHERQNLVPVDWVAAAIAHLVMRPALHGKTYHLTHPNAVSVRLMREVIQEVIAEFSDPNAAATAASESMVFSLMERFTSQMDTYSSYFRDDPVFDRTNAEAALGHLSLPEIDHDLLLRMSRYPIRHKFAPRRDFVKDTHTIGCDLSKLRSDDSRAALKPAFGLQINGRGGGQWTIYSADGCFRIVAGLPAQLTDLVYLNSHVYDQLLRQSMTVAQALANAQVVIEYGGDGAAGQARTQPCFEQLIAMLRQQVDRRQPEDALSVDAPALGRTTTMATTSMRETKALSEGTRPEARASSNGETRS